jgi:integrase
MGGKNTPTRRYTIAEHGEKTPSEARNEAIKLRGQVRSGIDPQAEKRARTMPAPKRQTFAETADAYLADAAKSLRPSSLKEWKRIIERDVKPRWAKRATADVTWHDVRELLNEIVDRGAVVQANRTLARVRRLFNWAVEERILAASPVAGLKPPTEETEGDRVLSDDEIRWFWRGCDKIGDPFGPLFKLLLLTIQRRDEVGTLEWPEVNLDKKLWTIPRGKVKNDRAHDVHLSEPAAVVLLAIRDGRARTIDEIKRSPFAFTTTGQTPVSGFSRAKERLDEFMLEEARKAALESGGEPPESLPDWILHDLRRTGATGMARLNVPPHVVDKILNHVTGTIRGVAAIYNRFQYLEERRTALEAWGRYVAALTAPLETNEVPLRA